MNWRRALAILAIAAFAGLCATLVARRMSADSARPHPPVPTTARIADRVTTAPATAPALTSADITRLSALGASPSDGPAVAIEGDFQTNAMPSAYSTNTLAKLPSDWTRAFLLGAQAAEAMGTPVADRGAVLQRIVSPSIYERWLQTLSARKSAGAFTLTRLYLAAPDVASSGELTFVGIGTYAAPASTPRVFAVDLTASRLRTGWIVTAIEFSEIAEGS